MASAVGQGATAVSLVTCLATVVSPPRSGRDGVAKNYTGVTERNQCVKSLYVFVMSYIVVNDGNPLHVMRRPQSPPDLVDFLRRGNSERLLELFQMPVDDSRYLHWDELRRRPAPDGVSHEEWWIALKLARNSAMRHIPGMRGADGTPMTFSAPDSVLERLHFIDGRASGTLGVPDDLVNPQTRTRYIMNSLIEEATRSSQLEGAVTTRQEAQAMIRGGTEPRNVHQRMVLNNYHAMEWVRRHRDDQFTPELVTELHAVVTEMTLPDEYQGRLQQPGEKRVAVLDRDGEVLNAPPAAEQLAERLALMCEFANGAGQGFIHPVLRAIIVHFWLAYDHPFLDGNGRTARALFYWSMLQQGYWVTEFLSISRILHAAPSQYARAFLHPETDQMDLTYFILYHLEVIERAIRQLDAYLEKKTAEIREVEALARDAAWLNHRQLALLSHALRHPAYRYTYKSHLTSHRVTRPTAVADLSKLHEEGLLDKHRVGREVVFLPVRELNHRLRKLGGA